MRLRGLAREPKYRSRSPQRFSGLPRHYFRYGVLFHRADYNLVATTTKTPAPRRMTCLTL
jgi:hypothetical protein